jgi:hypothetical protein
MMKTRAILTVLKQAKLSDYEWVSYIIFIHFLNKEFKFIDL